MVFTPLVINLAWIALYMQSLMGSTALLQATVDNGKVFFLTSHSVALFNKTGMSVFDFVKTSGSKLVKEKIRSESAQLLQTLTQLGQIMPEESSSRSTVENLTILLSGVQQRLDSLAEKNTLTESDIAAVELPRIFLGVMRETRSLLKSLDHSAATFGVALDAQSEECRRTRFIAISGLILNIAIAMALALFFKISIAERIAQVSSRIVSLSTGNSDCAPITSSDELSKLEGELVVAQKKLVDADQFRRVYMTAVAHRLRHSMNRCLQASSSLRDESELLKRDGEKYLLRLDASVSSCLSLIDDMLVLESLDLGNLQLNIAESNLHNIVEESIEIVSNLALAKQLSVVNQCASICLPVDSARTRQVLVNLLANAIKFSKTGESILVTSEEKVSFIRISVSDSGPGISKQASAKLFQKFFQTSEGKSAGGTGLGLAIAKLIVESHGGLIGVDSELGQGATFWVELPVNK